MKDLITYLAKALVDKPEDVVVTELGGAHSSVIELRVAKRIWARLSASMGEPLGR